MQLLQLDENDQREFAVAPESAMDFHLGRSNDDEFYLVIGCRVGVLLNERTFLEPESRYLEEQWLTPDVPAEAREGAFLQWLRRLPQAPPLMPATPAQAWQSFWSAMSPVTPIGTLPPTPARPSSIYGHLPFKATTLPQTVIYRWEAYPTSRRIDRNVSPPTIAQDTYAAPSSEAPFALTGFAAVARFALPNLMPALFRYELQPVAGTSIECGAAVPLYGQSGGGVEVKFINLTNNRCPIADPIVLPAL
jgi:hypothetical protein